MDCKLKKRRIQRNKTFRKLKVEMTFTIFSSLFTGNAVVQSIAVSAGSLFWLTSETFKFEWGHQSKPWLGKLSFSNFFIGKHCKGSFASNRTHSWFLKQGKNCICSHGWIEQDKMATEGFKFDWGRQSKPSLGKLSFSNFFERLNTARVLSSLIEPIPDF